MATAFVSPLDCRAVIDDGDKRYTFTPDEDPALKEVGPGLHVGMFLQPALAAQQGVPVEVWDAGEYPFEALKAKMVLRKKKYNAVRFFLDSLDSELTADLRQRFARHAEDLINNNSEIAEEIGRIMLSTELPLEFDVSEGPKNGVAGEIWKKVIAKWRPDSSK